jgi:hypothetical protein
MQAINIAFRSLPALSRHALCLLMCSGVWTQDVGAAALTYNLGFRSEHSDNIFRLPNERERQSEVINAINAGFSYLEKTSTFNASVVGSVVYNDYYRDTFADDTNFTLGAHGELFFVPEVISWVVADSFRKVQIDSLQPDIPTNRQNSNVFATGPNIYLRVGPVDTVTLEGRYGRAWTGNVDIDNDRDSFATRWAHRMSVHSTLSLSYEYLGVDYDNSILNDDFRRQNYFLRANVHAAGSDYTLDLGRTRIDLERGNPTSNWLIRLDSTWQTSSISSVNVLYGRGYSDTGAELLPTEVSSQASMGGAIPRLGADVVTGEPFYTERTDLSYTRRGSTFPWTARLFSRNIDYELSPNDRQEKGSLIDVSYLHSSSLSFQVSSGYTILSFDQPVSEIRDVNTGVGLTYRAGPSLTAGLDLRRFGRKSTDSSREYTDNRIAFTITYSN